jgi:alpha-tubulin suppressor-like RCC1 family protein
MTSRALFLVLLFGLFAPACGGDDDAPARADAALADASPPPDAPPDATPAADARRPDAAPDACVPRPAACDGLDDDCDGVADDADEAAAACPLAGGVARCGTGGCELASCTAGHADCNLDGHDGCETSTTTTSDCGACGVPCRRPNAEASCADGTCRVGACLAGFADCDGLDANGCETRLDRDDACGACGATCSSSHGVGVCEPGGCAIATCELGFDDCDGVAGNGCEASLDTLASCGACGRACSVAHGQPRCAAGSCVIDRCDAELADCDGDPGTGCERSTDLESDCGACGLACAGDELCRQGNCVALSSGVLGLGGGHACFVARDGRAWCWGLNNLGQLGNGYPTGANSIHPVPRPTVALDDAIAIDVGYVHTCAIRDGGRVTCFGGNADQQLGDGSITDAVSIAAGHAHTCAVRKSGKIACWGSNAVGRLGIGRTTPASSLAPLDVVGVSDAIQVDANMLTTCALRRTGTVECWGQNTDGQVGVPPSEGDVRGTPLAVIGVTDAVEVAMGGVTGCARRHDGTVRCWGRGTWGSRGDGSYATDTATSTVVGLSDARQLAAGLGHTCAVRADGTLVCWGLNDYGQLGDGTRDNRSTPTPVPGLTDVVQVSAYYFTTCARVRDGRTFCWGSNDSGEIGHEPVTTVCDPYHLENCSVSLAPFAIPQLPPP